MCKTLIPKYILIHTDTYVIKKTQNKSSPNSWIYIYVGVPIPELNNISAELLCHQNKHQNQFTMDLTFNTEIETQAALK